MVGQIVPRGWILRIQLARLLPLDLGRIIFMDVAQKAAVGQARAGVVGVAAEEIFVALFNRREPLPEPPVVSRYSEIAVSGRHPRQFGTAPKRRQYPPAARLSAAERRRSTCPQCLAIFRGEFSHFW